MQRRQFLASAAASLCFLAASPARVQAQTSFAPTRFTVTVRGRGPDVILIPGLTAGADVWYGLVAAVPGYRYHILHLGGMAGAPVAGNGSGAIVGPVADEIARYIAAQSLHRPALIGHSMGGTLAMMVAARRPELVGRVMVVDMLPRPSGLVGASPESARGLADRLRELGATPGGRLLVGSLIASFGTNGAGGRSDPDVVARAMQDLAALDLAPDLRRIAAPLTIVYANRDERSRARTDAAYAEAYAGARGAELVRIDGSGHMIMFDQPARLAEVVRTFLGR
jgi:pimeloyl-ACP methyl ester carboxylesterase